MTQKITPTQIVGTIPDSSLIVRDTEETFRPALQSDITALGFTPGGGGSGPYGGLDGVVFSSSGNMQYRANYRGDTVNTWGVGGKGCRYDDVNHVVYVSNDNNVKKYDTSGNLLTTITTSGTGGLLIGNNTTRMLFTENDTQVIDMDTDTVLGTIGTSIRMMDVSPDGSLVAVYDQTTLTAKLTARVRVYNTTSFVLTSTYIYPVVPFLNSSAPGDAILSFGGTFIDNIEFVRFVYGVNTNTSGVLCILQKLDITTATATQVTTLSITNPGGSRWGMKYSSITGLIYFGRYLTFCSCPTSLASYIDITTYGGVIVGIYGTSDNSICIAESGGSSYNAIKKIQGSSNKYWSSFAMTGLGFSQIAMVY